MTTRRKQDLNAAGVAAIPPVTSSTPPPPPPPPSGAAPTTAEPTEVERIADALAVLRAQFDALREQVEEHHEVLATRIDRRRRRIAHPRLYPQQ